MVIFPMLFSDGDDVVLFVLNEVYSVHTTNMYKSKSNHHNDADDNRKYFNYMFKLFK